MLEIENYADTQLRYPQLIQHQSTFVVRDFVDPLRIHRYGIKRNEIRNEEADFLILIEDVERRLLPKQNFSQRKLDDQRILVRLFN